MVRDESSANGQNAELESGTPQAPQNTHPRAAETPLGTGNLTQELAQLLAATIAHNQAIDRLRRETGVTRPKLVLVDEVPESAQSVDEELLLERDAALRAIASLSDAERRLVTRTYFRGMTAREISEDDGIPLGTVKTRLRSALIKVRQANQQKETP